MALTADQIVDLVTTTQRDLGRLKWTEIALDLQEYIALPKMLKKEKVRFDGGHGIQRNLMVDHSGAAKHVGMFAQDTVNVGDVMKTLNIPWRHTTTNYAFDRVEIKMNSTQAERIVELIKVRRADSMLSLAVLMEDTLWSKPSDSSDTLQPFGIPYWVVKNTNEGFNGGNPAGFSSGAGNIDSTAEPNWANYTNQYTDITKADAIFKMRRAYRKTGFKCPIDIPTYARGNDRYVIYVNLDTIQDMETLGEQQNENLGRDLASKDGKMLFRGNPITWVPKLDADTSDPIYFINWACFFPVFLRGEYLNESKPREAPNQHKVFRVHVDLTWNTLCDNRRRMAVLSK